MESGFFKGLTFFGIPFEYILRANEILIILIVLMFGGFLIWYTVKERRISKKKKNRTEL